MARRALAPRKNSCATLAKTKAAQQNIAMAAGLTTTPATSSDSSASSAAEVGIRKFRRALASVARRQAITGPMPLSSTSTSASGTV